MGLSVIGIPFLCFLTAGNNNGKGMFVYRCLLECAIKLRNSAIRWLAELILSIGCFMHHSSIKSFDK